MTNNAALSFNRSDAITVSNVISGTGTLTQAGSGSVTLAGANSYAGLTTVSAGTLAVGNATALGTTAAGTTVASGATLDLQNVAVGAEAVTLNGGTLAASTGTSSLGGGVTLGANSTVNIGGAQLTLSGVITDGAGTFGLTKNGTGTLILANANTYDGVTTVNQGTLAISNAAGLGSVTGGALVASGATLDLRNVAVGAETITLNGGTLATSTGTSSLSGGVTLGANSFVAVAGTQLTLSGIVSGANGLTKSGTGTLTLSGANTYSGTTTINAGTLALSGGSAIADTGAVDLAVSGASLVLNNNETIGSLSGVAGATVALGANTLTTGDAGNTAYAGVIGGTGGLIKQGIGSFTLSGTNTYTGTTAISAGTLAAANAAALGGTGGGTTVQTGATLDVNNVTLAAEPITINGAGVGGGGALTGTGTASISGAVTQGSNSTIGTTVGGSSLTLTGVVNAAGFTTDIRGAGDVTATNAGNDFSSVTVTNAGNVSLRDGSAISLGTSSLTGNLTVQAAGNVTVAGAINAGGATDAITLAGANFINTFGAGALTTTNPGATDRWLVYAGTHTGNTFGGLLSGNQAVWGTAYPTAVAQTGNRYVFANSPTLSVTSTNLAKTYGVDATAAVANAYGVTGFIDAAAFANVFTQDTAANTFTGTPTVTSTGSTALANVSGSPYAIAVDVAPLTATTGYTLSAVSTGQLTINRAVINLSGSRAYDGTLNFSNTTIGTAGTINTGIGGQTLLVTGGPGTVASANVAAGVQTLTTGTLALGDGTGLANNYTLTAGTHTGTVTAKSVTITGTTANNKVYDGATLATLSNIGTVATGIGGEALTLNGPLAANINFNTKDVTTANLVTGTGYSITDGTGLASNYALTSTTATAAANITTKALTASVTAPNKVYDGLTTATPTLTITGGLVGTETVTATGTASFNTKDVLTANLVTVNTTALADGTNGGVGSNYSLAA